MSTCRAKVGIGDFGADSEPAWANVRVAAEEVQSSATKTETLHNVKQLVWLEILRLDLEWAAYLFVVADFAFLVDEEVDVDVGVNEVTVGRATDDAFDSHQTVLLQPIEDASWLQRLLTH